MIAVKSIVAIVIIGFFVKIVVVKFSFEIKVWVIAVGIVVFKPKVGFAIVVIVAPKVGVVVLVEVMLHGLWASLLQHHVAAIVGVVEVLILNGHWLSRERGHLRRALRRGTKLGRGCG